ncbi:outer membrane protein TOM13-domain-containing protein [Podospora didyma]|uniref:Outer membrane protein TOM13-domain-containing protein n=1 Tax=Podospora didyma TaxID=330526 RepID=A0AAE0K666_9PEZI|nr:outer membrane protein TOM13-domain-containing protein [Podospora didyma]
MASEELPNPMAESGVTIPSDSEQYSGGEDVSTSPPSSSSPAVILYQPPTIWSLLRGATINLFLPFINGMMLGFGELFAHEAAFRLGWSGTRAFQNSSTRVQIQSRQFGTTLRNSTPTLRSGALGLKNGMLNAQRIGGPAAMAVGSQKLLSSLGQARYASTQPAPAPAPAAEVPPVATPEISIPDDLVSTPIDLSGADLLSIPEQLGFLKALGLDYGWGPTAMMEWSLEHIYVLTGLPWWASLAALAVSVRLLIFKPSLDAQLHTQKIQDMRKNPKYEQAMAAFKEAAWNPEAKLEVQKARTTISQMNKASGYKMWKTFMPMVNVPLGYGAFRLFRGMAALPVPSLENGGTLWFTDLTVCDPYYILPIATAMIFVQTFRIPLPYMALEQQKTMKIVAMVILPISIVFTCNLPAGIQFYFLVTGALQCLQSSLFYMPRFRRLVGLPPIHKTIAPARIAGAYQAPRAGGVSSTFKGGMDAAKEKFANYTAKNEKKLEVKKAKEYEDRRALEEKEKFMARRAARRRN